MFGPARVTLNEVTPNLHIYEKVELTIDVSMNDFLDLLTRHNTLWRQVHI